ncbi:MAG: hypothetical protein M3Q07_03740 [Pseudobdellovibrionaceae bacterium]|nr:hypothetical protein [Pseudobdellovibrionaceae bacterium]
MPMLTHQLLLTLIVILGLGIAPSQGRAANRILELIAPAELGQSIFYTDVIVSYETETTGELIVSITDPSNDWRVYATANVKAFAGRHTEKLSLLFAETLPISDTYVVDAKLLDHSGHEHSALAQKLRIRPENVPSAHNIIYIEMPSVYDPASTSTHSQVYIDNREPVRGMLSLKHPGRNWETYVSASFQSEPGYAHWAYIEWGRLPWERHPQEGRGYVWELKLFDASGELLAYKSKAVEVAYTSVTQGRLISYTATGPYLIPGGEDTVQIEYLSRGENDIRIDLVDPSDWAWYTGVQFTVANGHGTRAVPLHIPTQIADRSRLAVMIKMLPKGGRWESKFEEEGILRFRTGTFAAPKYWNFPLDGAFTIYGDRPSPHAPSIRARLSNGATDVVVVRGLILSVDGVYEPGRRQGYELDLVTGTLFAYDKNYHPPDAPYQITSLAHEPNGTNSAYREAIHAMRAMTAGIRRDLVHSRDDRGFKNEVAIMEIEMVEAYLTRIWNSL